MLFGLLLLAAGFLVFVLFATGAYQTFEPIAQFKKVNSGQ